MLFHNLTNSLCPVIRKTQSTNAGPPPRFYWPLTTDSLDDPQPEKWRMTVSHRALPCL